jgi:hypothetical protein
MKAIAVPPYLTSARRAIRRALPKLSEVQTLRLAATAELLAFGEDRGKWSLSANWSEQQAAQPYQIAGLSRTRRGASALSADRPSYQWQCDKPSKKGSK